MFEHGLPKTDNYLPIDRALALAWWGDLSPREKEEVSSAMRNLLSQGEIESPASKKNSTPHNFLSNAHEKACKHGLLGDYFCRSTGQKRIGLAMVYLSLNGGANEDSTGLHQALFGQNIAVIDSFWDAVNRHDLDKFESLLHENYEWVSDTLRFSFETAPMVAKGPRQGRQIMEAYYKSFPDLKFDVEHTYALGDPVITRWKADDMIHRGEFMGLEATGRKGSIRGCAVYTMSDGKILRSDRFWDTGYLLQQLGYRLSL
jgi:steroid delta-isomerase-like uncharacterized protein